MIDTMVRSFIAEHLGLAIGLAVLAGVALPIAAMGMHVYQTYRCERSYHFLNPRWRCTEERESQKAEYEIFSDELKSWIAIQEEANVISHVSIYFRDLESGPWFGINEQTEFSAASLLKVPIMMALLKQTEKRPELLSQELGYDQPMHNLQNVFDEEKTIVPGHYYTTEEILRRMIVYSDNNAKELLKARLTSLSPHHDLLAQSYADLGIFRAQDGLDSFLTVKTYASLFRALYNASYLSKSMSQKALDLLTQVEFRDGLVAGVPGEVEIAHKFGVREFEGREEKQLHDCGIIYHPDTPYLLCIMTRGVSVERNALVIQEISRRIYEEVSARHELLESSE